VPNSGKMHANLGVAAMKDVGDVVVLVPPSHTKTARETTILAELVAMACVGERALRLARVKLYQAVLAQRRRMLELKFATERTVPLPVQLSSFLTAQP
jgi:hypothetical protein